MLIEFIYTSHAKTPLSPEQLSTLKKSCIEYNTQHKITGMLLYNNMKFMQVLEGDKETILALFKKIKQDPRHHQVEALILNPIDERNFGQWAMGIADISNESIKPDFLSDPNIVNKALSKKLLLAFSHHLIEID
ncbi:BLUF domain-containing protein [Pseudoalteromonas tunicata]|uniref:BLUF domain-containing protein n=1 Tax=Pseudoalteromonas tunicata D2 TaxID=87626 RepID=A4CA03_9GAMM|nr:BLUF domain-containing protein [Pseudoalteromonas tunicata]ATC94761.1 hypothetical protein PTUN_a2249 [Pseudoalteromonas tunicata]AXT30462.1 BLUF domain-containing protein [Pseudoalteromonas tunicata]EAR28211.1 hypothetical protein PTD2_20387 [Pseudoalteromonas tunicata D2]